MESNNFIYQHITATPTSQELNMLLKLYADIFEDAKLDFFTDRIHQKENVLILVAFDGDTPIGFKVGYRYDTTTFYSWVGGVLSAYRKQGVAQQLLELQHVWAQHNGFQKIRTKSMNRFKPMLILNLKNGFDIVQVYTNDRQQTKIIFEKNLATP